VLIVFFSQLGRIAVLVDIAALCSSC